MEWIIDRGHWTLTTQSTVTLTADHPGTSLDLSGRG